MMYPLSPNSASAMSLLAHDLVKLIMRGSVFSTTFKEHGKHKRVAEEEEDQSCDGKTVSNKILKGQV